MGVERESMRVLPKDELELVLAGQRRAIAG